MKRMLMTALFAVALTLSAFSSASAAPPSGLGTPGDPNCEGQTRAFLAQAAKNGLTSEEINPGLGNLAAWNELSVAEVQEIVRAFCAGEGGV